MKRFFLMTAGVFILVAFFASCQEKDPNTKFTPQISFLNSSFSIPKGGSLVLTIAIDAPFDEEVRIPVTITGGELGTDYLLEGGSEVIVEAGKRTAEFKIEVPMAITESKKLTLTLSDYPQGYTPGRFPSTTVNITSEPTLAFSFSEPKVAVYGSTRQIQAGLYNANGNSVKVLSDTRIKVVVDASSTAVAGKHFRFLSGKDYVEIKAGQTYGYVTIEALLYEEGKTNIVLISGETNNYYDGNVPFVSVVLPKGIDEGVIGTWTGLKWTLDMDYYLTMWGVSQAEANQMTNSISPADKLTFSADGTMTVNMTGPLGKFFRDCNWTINGTEKIVIDPTGMRPVMIDAPKCELSVVNYSFSNTSPQLKPANMKMYMTYDPAYGDILNIYIDEDKFDYENSPIPFLWGYEALRYTFVRQAKN